MSLLQSQIKIVKEQRKLMSFVEYGSDTNFFLRLCFGFYF